MFAALAVFIVVSDQLLKQWIVANYRVDVINPVIGDWLRIDYIHNAGGLFGLFQGTAVVFAIVTIAVLALIAYMEVRFGWRSWPMTLALGLLLGGAIGNFIDRIRFGYVIDFADIGIGTWRWYVFNVADTAVTCFFLLIIGMFLFSPGHLGSDAERERSSPDAANAPAEIRGPEAK